MSLLPACILSGSLASVVRLVVRRLPDEGRGWYTTGGDGAAALSAGPSSCLAAVRLCWPWVALVSIQSRLTGRTASALQEQLRTALLYTLCRMIATGTASAPQLSLRLTTGTG